MRVLFVILIFLCSMPTTSGLAQTGFSASDWKTLSYSSFVNDADFSRDGNYFAVAAGGMVELFDRNFQRLWQNGSVSRDGAGGQVCFSADGRYLAIGNARGDGDLAVLSIAGKQLTYYAREHGKAITVLAFSPDGQYLAAGDYNNQFKIWRINSTAASQQTVRDHRWSVNDLAFTPDGAYLISCAGSPDNTVKIWRFSNGYCQINQTLTPWGGDVNAISISADGRYLAAGGNYTAVKLWQLSSGSASALNDLRLQYYPVRDLQFSPDSKYLAIAGQGKQIEIWQMNGSGASRAQTLAHASRSLFTTIFDLAFSGDGQYLAAGGSSSNAQIWKLSGVSGSSASRFASFLPIPPANNDRQTSLKDLTGPSKRSTETVAPTLTIYQPALFYQTKDNQVLIKGKASDDSGIHEVLVNNQEAVLQRSGEFQAEVKLKLGSNSIVVKAVDINSNSAEKTITVLREEKAQIVDVDVEIPAGAQNRPDAVAVVIGNKNYQHGDVPAVEFAQRDAEYIKRYLIKTLGYREANIIYQTDAGKSAFESIFGNAADYKGKLYNYIKPNVSDVFVYYSGHGAPHVESGKSFFVPSDADPQVIHLNGYPVEQLYANLAKLPAKSITVVVDACFSGFSNQGALIKNISPAMLVVENPVMNDEKMWVFSAARNNQVSSWYPEMKHGLFTYFFLKGLQGNADQNQDRTISSGEMRQYLEENVPYMARRLNGRDQNPQAMGRNPGQVLVRLR